MKTALHFMISFLSIAVSQGTVCREETMIQNLWKRRPDYKKEMDWRGGMDWTPRSILKALRNCTVYYGNIKIKERSTVDVGFEEYVRYEDLINLKNLREIYGLVYLNLKKLPEIRTLSFFNGLRKIQSSERGFTLLFSQVEMIDFSNVQLNVHQIGIGYNSQLCYLDKIQTINSSSTCKYIIVNNKDAKKCARQDKVCSDACNPDKGCWGPLHRNCFECQFWRAGEECIDSCDSRKNYFTPSEGKVCGTCHENCTHGCFGPSISQCSYSRPKADDHCPNDEYFDNAQRQCKQCSSACFGEGYNNRHRLIVRACSGPGNQTGPDGCSFRCQETADLTVSSDGRIECIQRCASYRSHRYTNLRSRASNAEPLSSDTIERTGNETTNEILLNDGIGGTSYFIIIIITIIVLVAASGLLGLLLACIFSIKRMIYWKRRYKASLSSKDDLLEVGGAHRMPKKDDLECLLPGQLKDETRSIDIFISYESHNEQLIKEIYSQLQNRGFSCWMSSGNGKNKEEDTEMIHFAKVFLVCVTKEYTSSFQCNIEVFLANFLEHQSKSNYPVIVPLILDGSKWPPTDKGAGINMILSLKKAFRLQEKDFHSWSGQRVDALLTQLGKMCKDSVTV